MSVHVTLVVGFTSRAVYVPAAVYVCDTLARHVGPSVQYDGTTTVPLVPSPKSTVAGAMEEEKLTLSDATPEAGLPAKSIEGEPQPVAIAARVFGPTYP